MSTTGIGATRKDYQAYFTEDTASTINLEIEPCLGTDRELQQKEGGLSMVMVYTGGCQVVLINE
jgi:hypothetical protein